MILTLYKCTRYELSGPDVKEFDPRYCVHYCVDEGCYYGDNRVIAKFPFSDCGRRLCTIKIDTDKCNLSNAQLFRRIVEDYHIEGEEQRDIAKALNCEYVLDS